MIGVIPRFTRGAAVRIRDHAHLCDVLLAHRLPEVVWSDPRHSDREHRRRGSVQVIVTSDNTIIGCCDVELNEPGARSELLRSSSSAPKRKQKGPAGTRWPTTVRELLQRCQRAGAEVSMGGRHLRVRLPGSTRFVSLAITPSDWRSVKNTALQLHRIGVNVARF